MAEASILSFENRVESILYFATTFSTDKISHFTSRLDVAINTLIDNKEEFPEFLRFLATIKEGPIGMEYLAHLNLVVRAFGEEEINRNLLTDVVIESSKVILRSAYHIMINSNSLKSTRFFSVNQDKLKERTSLLNEIKYLEDNTR
ncbi:MAG: hypothetical protein ACRC5M_05670, partial [Anaeroplasmataceae bacterium]